MRNIFDNRGFLDLNRNNFTPLKVIEGGDITMEGVSNDIFAYPVRDGQVQNPTLMRPNENHNFNSDYVIEVPKLQNGDRFSLNRPNNSALQFQSTFNDNLFNRQRLNTLNTVQPPYLQGNANDIDGDGVPNYIDRRDELAGIYGTTERENIYGGYVSAPFIEANDRESGFQRTGFSDFIQDPASLTGVDLNTALFRAGQSFGFDPSILQNADAQRQARRGNIMRGVGAVGKSLLNIGRLVGAGIGFQNQQDHAYENYLRQLRESRAGTGNYQLKNGGLMQYFRSGGTVQALSTEKALTGEYITGLPKNREDDANAEVEKGEYIMHPNTDVQKVVGNTHERGGEKVNLEDGTKVVSDNLKIGGDLSSILRKEYDIKTKAKDTYANTIDKYTKKIGLSALNKEQEALFKKLEKEEDTKDDTTANLNRQFLSGRIREIEKEKSSLLAQRKDFVEMIFDKQEKNKTAEEKLPVFKKGGTFNSREFKSLCKRHGISEEEGAKLVSSFKNGGKKKRKYQGGGGFTLQPNAFRTSELSPVQFRQGFTDVGFGNNTSGNVNSSDILNARVAELIRLNPILAQQAFGSPDGGFNINAERVGIFQNGFNDNANAIIDFVNSSDDFTDEEKKTIVASVTNEMFIKGDKKGNRDIDHIFGNRTSSVAGFQFNAVTPEDRKKLEKLGITSYKQLLTSDGKINPELGLSNTSTEGLSRFENFTGNFLLGEVEIPDPAVEPVAPIVAATPAEVEEAAVAPPDPNAGINQLPNVNRPRQSTGIVNLPDQSKLPPNAVSPHLKIERQFERLDPVKITNEDNLKEIFRQQDFAAEQLEGLPDSQRRSVLASMVANSQEVANKSVTQTNLANAQNFQRTEQINLQQSNLEENYRASDLLDFERRQLTAFSNTQRDLDNFFDYNNSVRLGNFNTVSQINTLNDIYENFNVGSDGSLQLDPTQQTNFVQQLVAQAEQQIAENSKKKNK